MRLNDGLRPTFGGNIAVFFGMRDGFQMKPVLPQTSAWMGPLTESIVVRLWQNETKARSLQTPAVQQARRNLEDNVRQQNLSKWDLSTLLMILFISKSRFEITRTLPYC
jgi:hypothetical protein